MSGTGKASASNAANTPTRRDVRAARSATTTSSSSANKGSHRHHCKTCCPQCSGTEPGLALWPTDMPEGVTPRRLPPDRSHRRVGYDRNIALTPKGWFAALGLDRATSQ